jgi:hypothetical protein
MPPDRCAGSTIASVLLQPAHRCERITQKARSQYPEAQASATAGPDEHRELLPKRQILKRELPPRLEQLLIT